MSDAEVRDRFGPNDWLVDEMYRQYQQDPSSVSESWREFFEDYRPHGDGRTRSAVPARVEPAAEPEGVPRRSGGIVEVTEAGADAEQAGVPASKRPSAPSTDALQGAVALRGAAARIASNMEASLSIPTATSVRTIPAKLLEENRRLINDHLASTRGGKVSFTHIVGWAVIKALQATPALSASYREIDGKPYAIRHEHVNLGLAVDVKKGDGSRTLMVPNIKEADLLDFSGFWSAYEDVIRRVRANEIRPDDFAGTTATLTNPGTIGTVMSVPRLMPGQGVIVGTGAIDYPSEYRGADPIALADLGIGKVITITSTYDHRIIQGAESGEFLDAIDDQLSGAGAFYDEIFESLAIPYVPVRWSRDRGVSGGRGATDPVVEKNARVLQLINMYRVRGHLVADLNPLTSEARTHIELDPAFYSLGVWDLDRPFFTGGLGERDQATLREVLDLLRDAYCRTVGIEYMHIQEADQKRWIQERVEGERPELDRQAKIDLLHMLNAAESFERFLHTKYVGHKRFGLEGAESLIPMLGWLLDDASGEGIEEVVMGMAHRGRLNVLSNILGKSYDRVFREFEGDIDPETTQGSGDVKYHLGARGEYVTRAGRSIAVSLASNPSHLEAVDAVVEGITRAKQDLAGADGAEKVLPVLVHGDGAFAGQGVVAETFNLSELPGYATGGTIHIVVNNLIAFTTTPEASRSGVYATDVAKMVQAPIFHVNGDDPEACVRVVGLAFAFRQAFRKDVVVDVICYRRYGHNEADEPAFTQPLMYAKIDQHRSVRKLYTEKLVNRGDITLEEAEGALDDFRRRLDDAFEQTHKSAPQKVKAKPPRPPRGVRPPIETGVPLGRLEHIAAALSTFPDSLEPHPKLARMVRRHADSLRSEPVDWALAEALALGSMLLDGKTIRFAGQDSRRGTFSQRHAVLVDQRTDGEYAPLQHIEGATGKLLLCDSPLSEYAALGFEYGYAVGNREALVVWEAQFGDFVNGAQIVVDEYVVAAEDKWGQTCGVVLLLPHGYEGQGPDHSSSRLERFLTLCAEDNIQVAFPTAAAQYFHLLRRQAAAAEKKPLIVLTPKSLLRHPMARSPSRELTAGHFHEVLGDPADLDPARVTRILLCTGKIAIDLLKRRDDIKSDEVAVVRLEQLYPFPHLGVDDHLGRYPSARDVVWIQEEPENMGAWTFIFSKLHRQVPGLRPIARPESASPASGSAAVHQQEQDELLEEAFEELP